MIFIFIFFKVSFKKLGGRVAKVKVTAYKQRVRKNWCYNPIFTCAMYSVPQTYTGCHSWCDARCTDFSHIRRTMHESKFELSTHDARIFSLPMHGFSHCRCTDFDHMRIFKPCSSHIARRSTDSLSHEIVTICWQCFHTLFPRGVDVFKRPGLPDVVRKSPVIINVLRITGWPELPERSTSVPWCHRT